MTKAVGAQPLVARAEDIVALAKAIIEVVKDHQPDHQRQLVRATVALLGFDR